MPHARVDPGRRRADHVPVQGRRVPALPARPRAGHAVGHQVDLVELRGHRRVPRQVVELVLVLVAGRQREDGRGALLPQRRHELLLQHLVLRRGEVSALPVDVQAVVAHRNEGLEVVQEGRHRVLRRLLERGSRVRAADRREHLLALGVTRRDERHGGRRVEVARGPPARAVGDVERGRDVRQAVPVDRRRGVVAAVGRRVPARVVPHDPRLAAGSAIGRRAAAAPRAATGSARASGGTAGGASRRPSRATSRRAARRSARAPARCTRATARPCAAVAAGVAAVAAAAGTPAHTRDGHHESQEPRPHRRTSGERIVPQEGARETGASAGGRERGRCRQSSRWEGGVDGAPGGIIDRDPSARTLRGADCGSPGCMRTPASSHTTSATRLH